MKVYLHIGTHKTGTTALQTIFDANRKLLAEAGVLYPAASPPPHEGLGHQGLARAILESESDSAEWSRLREELERPDQRLAVISSEAFSSLEDDQMPVLLSYLEGHDVEVIVYLRRQDEYVHGVYCTQVLFYGESRDFQDWRRASAVDTLLDYRVLLARWERHFGREALTVRPYERVQLAGGDIVSDFAEQIGLELPADVKLQQRHHSLVNRSLPKNAISVVRSLHGSAELEEVVPEAVETLFQIYDGERSDSDLLSPVQRRAVLDACAEANSEVARRYLGREDGRLFFDLEVGDEDEWNRRHQGQFADLVGTMRDAHRQVESLHREAHGTRPGRREGLEYSREVSPNDHMWNTGPDWYFKVGLSALTCIDRAIEATGRIPKSILDMACGHGRVCRMLRAGFPDAEIIACDIDRDGIAFCAETFGADPVYSEDNPSQLVLGRRVDLIWCGSFLTHLDREGWRQSLDFFEAALNPGGVLVFTCHGRQVESWIVEGRQTYGLTEAEQSTVLEQYRSEGFGFIKGEFQPMGFSISAMSYVSDLISEIPDLQLVGFHEAGWAAHQDAVSCVKMASPYARHAPVSSPASAASQLLESAKT